jgi:DNA-binding MarR family transcriptional regulator
MPSASKSKPPRPPANSVDPEGEFPLGPPEYFFYLLFQAVRQRDQQFDRLLKPTGLNLAQWRSMAIIRRLEACTMSSLARYSAVERTTLTRAVDQLVRRGLVGRWTPEHDRRRVNLLLTDEGEAIYRQAIAIIKDLNATVLEDADPDRLRDATRLLQTVLRKLTGADALAMDLLTFGRNTAT